MGLSLERRAHHLFIGLKKLYDFYEEVMPHIITELDTTTKVVW